MATILLDNNNNLKYTQKSVIMQRSNLVDDLNILIPKYYNGIDMSKYYLYLHYVTPISREHNVMQLSVDTAIYNNNYTGTTIETDKILSYKIQFTTELTKESGKLEVWLTFYNPDVIINDNDEIELSEPYRVSHNCYIPITKASDYDNIMMSSVKGAYDAQISVLSKKIQDMQKELPVDVVLSDDNDNIHLISSDGKIGEGVDTINLSNIVGSNITSDDEQFDNEADGIINADLFEEVR